MRFSRRPRLRSGGSTAIADRAAHLPGTARLVEHLEHVNSVAALLARSRTLHEAFDAALATVAGVLPLTGAIMIEDDAGTRSATVWPARNGGPSSVAMAHAEAVLASLAATPPAASPIASAARSDTPASAIVVLPLAVGGRPVFGVLQLEAKAFDTVDLVFVNAIASLFAVALDRDRAWRREETHRIRSEAIEETLRERTLALTTS